MANIEQFLRRVGLGPEVWPHVRVLFWRGFLLGTALYLLLTSDPVRNLRYNAIAFIAAYIWTYYDGLMVKRRWSLAWTEALFLHLLTVQFGNILILIFGSPLPTAG